MRRRNWRRRKCDRRSPMRSTDGSLSTTLTLRLRQAGHRAAHPSSPHRASTPTRCAASTCRTGSNRQPLDGRAGFPRGADGKRMSSISDQFLRQWLRQGEYIKQALSDRHRPDIAQRGHRDLAPPLLPTMTSTSTNPSIRRRRSGGGASPLRLGDPSRHDLREQQGLSQSRTRPADGRRDARARPGPPRRAVSGAEDPGRGQPRRLALRGQYVTIFNRSCTTIRARLVPIRRWIAPGWTAERCVAGAISLPAAIGCRSSSAS